MSIQQTVAAEGATDKNTKTHRRAVGRKLAVVAGLCYLVTHVTSVGALILYTPMLNSVNYITGSGPDNDVLVGGFLELFLAFGVIGTAVALFPIVRRKSEAGAIGYVGLRTLEAGIIAIGVVSLLAVVTLRQSLAGATGTDTASLITIGEALVAFHNWTFLIGPSFTSGLNTVVIAYVLYQARLVPRFIPVLGLIGGTLVFASATAVLFGFVGQYSTWPAIIALPEFAWELSLAIYLIARGFRSSALAPQ
jgi:hypothetical protein